MTDSDDQLQPINRSALIDLLDETGYDLIQRNGQRIFGPPPDWGIDNPPPPNGSEVFVGKIPRDCYENELVPIFARIGRIYQLRLMMDFGGTNRGYAFVTFANVQVARRAIAILNNYEVRPKHRLLVVKSVDNCRLFVGGIDRERQRDEILHQMADITRGVVDVIVYRDLYDKNLTRGFAFVEYESHRAAAIARRVLIPGNVRLFNENIVVDWATPESEVDEDVMSKVRVLYVRNLMVSTTEDCIHSLFGRNCKGTIERVKKIRDFAFVHFSHREDAQIVLKQFNGTMLHGSRIEVTWAKPRRTASNHCGHLRSIEATSTPTLTGSDDCRFLTQDKEFLQTYQKPYELWR